MLFALVLNKLLGVLRYPFFDKELIGEYRVGAIQTRLPGSTACQIHYPAASFTKDNDEEAIQFYPYFRPKAIAGLADYSRTSVSLMEFLSNQNHPCSINAKPCVAVNDETKKSSFPVVIFSHGLGGCMDMYTQLCQQIASKGFCVIALEHEDGSGCFAETAKDETVLYKRPDDSPYSRQKVVNFRKPFLSQRVQETMQAIQYIWSWSSKTENVNNEDDSPKIRMDNDMLLNVLQIMDTSKGVTLLGHSFGGASMTMVAQELLENSGSKKYPQLESIGLLDCWAFALDDERLKDGIQTVPILSILSESWLQNPETKQVKQLLRNSKHVESIYVPNSVHTSVSDASGWLPGFVTRRFGMRGKKEKPYITIRSVAKAVVQHFQTSMTWSLEGGSSSSSKPSDPTHSLQPFPITTDDDEEVKVEEAPVSAQEKVAVAS